MYAVQADAALSAEQTDSLRWLLGGADLARATDARRSFRRSPARDDHALEHECRRDHAEHGIAGIRRIEQFVEAESEDVPFDAMLQRKYRTIDQQVFTISKKPDPIVYIDDMAAYNRQEGLALSDEEIAYLESVSRRIGRKLTDSEVFGFSQVNSEHCRHKIFNGQFVIDGEAMPSTLFGLIKRTTKEHPGRVVSAYKDNCAFLQGPAVEQFSPAAHDTSDYFRIEEFESVISVKAETHNFPTTVEPFNGAATGTGGEIRDRIAGGKGGRSRWPARPFI